MLYSARHTFATYALAATGNLAAVMKAMGHSSAQTAMIYQHPGLDAIHKAIDNIDRQNIESVSATKTYQRALSLTANAIERHYLTRRLQRARGAGGRYVNID